MEYVDNTDWKALFHRFKEVDVRYYTFQLLIVIYIAKLLTFFSPLIIHPDRRWTSSIAME